MSISSEDLVRRNAAFAATGAFVGLPFPASDTLQVLGCVDSRVDPGDAALMGPAGSAWPGPAPERAPGDPAPHRLRHHPPYGLPRAARRVLRDPGRRAGEQ